jgi:hypothetical protein
MVDFTRDLLQPLDQARDAGSSLAALQEHYGRPTTTTDNELLVAAKEAQQAFQRAGVACGSLRYELEMESGVFPGDE